MTHGRDYCYDELMNNTKGLTDAVALPGNHPHYILYTSGSTGAPKGILRDQAGTSVGASYAMKYLMGIDK